MLKNHIKIAWRNLQRNPVYSLINVVGLTIGLATCLLVATVVLDELSYETNWKNYKNIFRIVEIDQSNKMLEQKSISSLTGLSPELKKQFPEVTDFCRMTNRDLRLRLGENRDGVVLNGLFAEPSVFKVLDFKILEGLPEKFVKGYTNLIISEKIKKQFFPNTDPVGKELLNLPEFGSSKRVLITGIIKNIPSNTHLRADVLVLHEYSENDNHLNKNGDGNYTCHYLLLKPSVNPVIFTKKINSWFKTFVVNQPQKLTFQLEPMADTYLHSDFAVEQKVKGSMRTVLLLSGAAILLLLIACINFINLSTARALKRLREVGIRKVLGASRKELIAQFLFESIFFFLMSFLLTMVVYHFSLAVVIGFLERPISINLFSSVALLFTTCGVVLLISLLTGIYPAFLISGKRLIETISGNPLSKTLGRLMRKGLVITQFVISITIIIASFIIRLQLNFIDHKDLGYDKNNLVSLQVNSWEGKGLAFKQELRKIPGIENSSIVRWDPSEGGGSMSTSLKDPDKKDSKLAVWYIDGDFDLVSTLKFHLRSGRLLNPKLLTDAVNTDSLMEHGKAAELLQKEHSQPILLTQYTAKIFNVNLIKPKAGFPMGFPVGIINDFNNESLHLPLEPTIIKATRNPDYGNMLIRINPSSKANILPSVYTLWKKFYPEKVFQFSWVSEKLKAKYRSEQKLQQLFTFFSFLIVFLACLGLFSLAEFASQQRTKEIGIRKVLGASVANITALFCVEFLQLIGIAILIASPIAWFAMNIWLHDFAYRIQIEWWMFCIAGGLSAAIALITISFQTFKAATVNPVDTLRRE